VISAQLRGPLATKLLPVIARRSKAFVLGLDQSPIEGASQANAHVDIKRVPELTFMRIEDMRHAAILVRMALVANAAVEKQACSR
jgi:hypothetical protein